MGLKPGMTNNRNGRPKGRGNRATKSTREFIERFVRKNTRTMQRDFMALEPNQRLLLLEKLFAFTTPKMSSVDANVDVNAMTDEQLDIVISTILKRNASK